MKKKMICLLTAVGILSGTVTVNVMADYDMWDGTTDVSWYSDDKDFFEITTAEQLAGLAVLVNDGNNFLGKTVTLKNDIILNDGEVVNTDGIYSFASEQESLNEWTPIGKTTASKRFKGTFDGSGHTVSGMYMDGDNTNQALFNLSDNCTITNLTVSNSLIIMPEGGMAGSVIAAMPNAKSSVNISYCESDIVITDNGTGTGTAVAGGIVGSGRATSTYYGTTLELTGCIFSGTISLTSGNGSTAGGIVGTAGTYDIISDCYNTGSITADTYAAGIAGDLKNDNTVQGCYNKGDVTSDGIAAGIAANCPALSGGIKGCYNTGSINGGEGYAISGAEDAADFCIGNLYLTGSGTDINTSGKAEEKSEEDLKTVASLNILNKGSDVYVLPDGDDNDGYPVQKSLYYREKYKGTYTVTDPMLSGTTMLGDVITLSYIAEGNEEALSKITYKWQISDSESEGYTDYPEAIGESVTVTRELANKWLRAEITLPLGEKLYTPAVYVDIYDSAFEGTIENLRVRGIFEAGATIYFAYDSDTVTNDNIFEIQWLKSTQEFGTNYEACGNGESVVTGEVNSKYYYKVKITLINGNEYESAPVAITPYSSVRECGANGTPAPLEPMLTDTPEEYTFTLGGKDFILLQVNETSDTSRFYVLADDIYGSYVLNSFKDEDIAVLMPEGITEYADVNAWWSGTTEAWGNHIAGRKRMFYAPLLEEVRKHSDKIGLSVDGADYWITRTNSARTADARWVFGVCGNDFTSGSTEYTVGTFMTNLNPSGNVSPLRPAFFLSKDFFSNIKVERIGEKAAEMVRGAVSKSEMINIYTNTELEDIWGYTSDFVIENTQFYKDGSGIADLNSADFTITTNIKSVMNTVDVIARATVYTEDGKLVAVQFRKVPTVKDEAVPVEFNLSEMPEGSKYAALSVLSSDSLWLGLADTVYYFK